MRSIGSGILVAVALCAGAPASAQQFPQGKPVE
ncbi:MAG: hypothetical protein QOK01_863, partial [Alphaproteobacteria bacterium]|nr:hypothetical protein [Alphaproteobacteria bacterium]